jgi:Mrp family chromosome partitioning ATPase
LPAPAPHNAFEPPEDQDAIPFIEVPEPGSLRRPAATATATARSEVPSQQRQPQGSVQFEVASAVVSRVTRVFDAQLVVAHQPDSPAAQEYRQAARLMQAHLHAERQRSLLLLPAEPAHDHSPATVNLALAFGLESRQRVLLIDADRHAQRIASLLGLASAPGWSELVAGFSPAQVIQDTGWPNLHVVAAGNRLALSRRPGVASRLAAVMQELRGEYEVILVSAARRCAVMELVDGVCVVTRRDGTHGEDAIEELRAAGVCVVGSLVVD